MTAAPIAMIDLAAEHAPIRAELEAAFARVIDAGRFILGPEVEALERAIAALAGCEHAVGVSSGTDALLACLMAEGVGPGDEVVVPAYSFFATAGVVARLGATPVFADVDADTWCLDPRSAEAAIGPRTRAIVPVHLFGQPADMAELLGLARARGLFVLEDAAQAIGATYRGAPVGSIGDAGALSFFPTKNLGGLGDGGMVVTNDAARAGRLRALRTHGAAERHLHALVGGNFRLDALQAAALRVKLRHLPARAAARARHAARYADRLAPLVAAGRLELPSPRPDRTHVHNQIVVRCRDRDRVRAALAARGIATDVYYPRPLHDQPCFAHLPRRDLPVATRLAATSLALPVHPMLSEQDVDDVASALFDVA